MCLRRVASHFADWPYASGLARTHVTEPHGHSKRRNTQVNVANKPVPNFIFEDRGSIRAVPNHLESGSAPDESISEVLHLRLCVLTHCVLLRALCEESAKLRIILGPAACPEGIFRASGRARFSKNGSSELREPPCVPILWTRVSLKPLSIVS